jgi:hypothetical protein
MYFNTNHENMELELGASGNKVTVKVKFPNADNSRTHFERPARLCILLFPLQRQFRLQPQCLQQLLIHLHLILCSWPPKSG